MESQQKLNFAEYKKDKSYTRQIKNLFWGKSNKENSDIEMFEDEFCNSYKQSKNIFGNSKENNNYKILTNKNEEPNVKTPLIKKEKVKRGISLSDFLYDGCTLDETENQENEPESVKALRRRNFLVSFL